MNHACFKSWCHCVERLDQICIAMVGGILTEHLQDVGFIDFVLQCLGKVS